MRKMIIAHCKALMRQQGALLCFMILFLSITANFIINVMKYWQKELAIRPSFLEISVLSESNNIGWYLVSFFAFLVVLPGGLSLAIDRKTKEDILWCTRCGGRRNYMVSRMLSVFLVTFLCFAIPLLMELLLNLLAFPMEARGNFNGGELYRESYDTMVKPYFMFHSYYFYPVLYALVRIGITGLMAGMLSLVPLACSCVFSKYYAYLLVPVYLLLSLLEKTTFRFFGIKFCHNYYEYLFWCDSGMTWKSMCVFGIMLGILSIVSVIFILFSAKRGQDN